MLVIRQRSPGESWELPEFHIWLNTQELLETDSPRLSGCGLEHEPSKLGMEHRKRVESGFDQCCGMSILPFADLLLFTCLDVRDASPFGGQLLIGSQCCENICLAQRQQDLRFILGICDNQVFNLTKVSSLVANDERGRSTSSPQSRASRSFVLALFQISSSCYAYCKFRMRVSMIFGAYLYTPFPDFVCMLFRIWPIQGRPKCTTDTVLANLCHLDGHDKPLDNENKQ